MTNATPTIVLKTIHNDILKDDKNSTLTTKQMRAKLRVKMADVHVRNSSWIFTDAQYDEVRAMFDPKYAAKLERAAKRKTTTKRKPKAKSTETADAEA
jgi:hypothetical protein